MTKRDKHGSNNGPANGHANAYVNGNGPAPKKADDVPQPGLLAGEYAKGKQQLMALINDLRSDGAALEVECVICPSSACPDLQCPIDRLTLKSPHHRCGWQPV